jgi:peroxiredoxin
VILALAGVFGFGMVRGESPAETVHNVAHAVGAPCCSKAETDHASASHDEHGTAAGDCTYCQKTGGTAASHGEYCRKPGADGSGGATNASQSASLADGPTCAPALAEAAAAEIEVTEDEAAVVSYIADLLMEGSPPAFEAEDIEAATGVSMESIDEGILRSAVVQELLRRGVDLAELVGAGTCSQLSACSVHRNLAGAQGEELERYRAEKALDGQTYANWTAPDFSLPSTTGDVMSLADARGRPVAVVLLSGHCIHSMDTLPLLAKLRAKYAAEDLAILPVYVNSGSVEDVSSWSSPMNLNLPLLVDEGKNLADQYESYLVPSTFLIDANGQVTRKLVGFKDEATLDQAFQDLIS